MPEAILGQSQQKFEMSIPDNMDETRTIENVHIEAINQNTSLMQQFLCQIMLSGKIIEKNFFIAGFWMLSSGITVCTVLVPQSTSSAYWQEYLLI